VLIATQKPHDLSALNVIEARVICVRARSSAIAEVELACGDCRMWANVTHRSAQALKLAPGALVFAIVKSVALNPAG